VLWVLAVGSYWTFAHRMYHTWRELTKADTKTANVDDKASYSQASGSNERPKQAEVPI
jgi:hypothetical protein